MMVAAGFMFSAGRLAGFPQVGWGFACERVEMFVRNFELFSLPVSEFFSNFW